MSEDVNKELEDIIEDVTQDAKSTRILNRLLFREYYPVHKVKQNIGVLDLILTVYVSLFLGTLGFVIWGNFTLLGFLIYYSAVSVIVLEIFHVIYDR